MSSTPDHLWLWLRGSDRPPAPPRVIESGPFRGLVDGSDLRRLAFRGTEIVRRAYAAVRDPNWGTVEPQQADVALKGGLLRWRASFRADELALDASGEYDLSSEGTMSAVFRGEAGSGFRFNRIGLCLLLPPHEFAGQPYVADGPEGRTEGVLPERIGEQRIVGGLPAPLFPSFTGLELLGRSGVRVVLSFEGDLFEAEDQRNWTDDSFKIYSTPLALGFPHRAALGQRFEQRILVRAEGARSRRPRSHPAVVEVRVGEPLARPLPRFGLGQPSHGEMPTASAAELLRAVRPEHLRVSVAAGDGDARVALEHGLALASMLGSRLRLVLSFGSEDEEQLESLAELVSPLGPELRDLIVLAAGEETAGGERVRLARSHLAASLPAARFHGGTDASFCQLNRSRIATNGVDGLVYAIHPQEHAFDDASLFETLPVQGETVVSAQARFPNMPILVGPVTLRPRFNAAATEPEREPAEGLPAQVDPRQRTLLAAAWTVGSLKYLSEAGADSVTYYETTGWRGLIERDAGPPRPDLFPSRPGEVFPLYHPIADVAELAGSVHLVRSSDPLAAVGLAVGDSGAVGVLLANLRPEPTEVDLAPLPRGRRRVRRLNGDSVATAAFHPAEFRELWRELPATGDGVRIRLEPYEVARLEAA